MFPLIGDILIKLHWADCLYYCFSIGCRERKALKNLFIACRQPGNAGWYIRSCSCAYFCLVYLIRTHLFIFSFNDFYCKGAETQRFIENCLFHNALIKLRGSNTLCLAVDFWDFS